MRIKLKILVACITIVIIITASFGIVVKSFNKERINVLIYGVDGRENDFIERSDSIMLANLNYATGVITLTSIPRDSYVKVTCEDNKYDKINHAYAYGGTKCLKNTVEQLFQIQQVKTIMLDFDNVINLVDYFGLIEIIPNNTFCQSDESFANKYCFEKGKKTLINGTQALAYMRNRKSLPNGDLDRAKNQRQIFNSMLKRFMKLGLADKIKFLSYCKENIITDIDIKDVNIKSLIKVNNVKISEYTLKGEDYFNTYYYYKLDDEYLEKIKKMYI